MSKDSGGSAEHAAGRTIRQVIVADQGVLTNSTEDFDEGQLRYRDMRKLTGMRLVHGERLADRRPRPAASPLPSL